MKAKIKETEPVFKPVTLELVFESEREMKLIAQWVGNTDFHEIQKTANTAKDLDFPSISNFTIDDARITSSIFFAIKKKLEAAK